MKSEFEAAAGTKVSDGDYEAANLVYMHHPACKDKKDIGTLWKMGGRALIDDMTRRARRVRYVDEALFRARSEVNRLNDVKEQLSRA